MGHVLNKLTNVKLEDIKHQLEQDAEAHAANGLYLEHIWKNDDNENEIFFLFRVDDLAAHKAFMKKIQEKVRKENPKAPLPEKIFLADV